MTHYTKVLAQPEIDYAKSIGELMEREEADAQREWELAAYARSHRGALAVILAGLGAV